MMEIDVIEQMIKESGRVWLETADRTETGSGPIIVIDSPGRAFYLERRENYQGDLTHTDGWVLIQQPLLWHDAASFFAAFGSQWPLLLRSHFELNGKPRKIRALIKNGRKEDWTISLDMGVLST